MKSKTKISIKIREWHAFVNLKTKEKTVILKIDNVKKYQKFDRTTQFDDVYMKFITAYIFEKNGVAKKCNRTIVQMTRSMLIWAKLPQRFWNETICIVNYFRNMMPAERNKKKSPNELWNDCQSNVSHIRKFECLIYVHISSEVKAKLDQMIFFWNIRELSFHVSNKSFQPQNKKDWMAYDWKILEELAWK